jgi:hypothetical protein
MAIKKQVLKAPKPKKQKFTGRAVSVAQIKLGGEPVLGISPSKMDLIKAFNWYAQCIEREQRTRFLVEYMKQEKCFTTEQILFVEKKGRKFPETWAYIARMLTNGAFLDEETKCRLHSEFTKFFDRYQEVEYDDDGNPIEVERKVKKVFCNQSVIDAINRIELEIEATQAGGGNPDLNWYEELVRLGVAAKDAKEIQSYFTNQFQEFLLLYNGKDDELNEGYRHLKKIVIQRLAVLVTSLRKDLDALVAAKKERVRKVRKKKEVPAAKQIAKMRFLKESTEYKVASVDPTKVVGAKALVTFNAKSRMLTIFDAKDDKGIQVKRTNLLNCTSRVKKLRKPEETLATLMNQTRVGSKNVFEALKTTEFESNNKTTTDTILLRVFS